MTAETIYLATQRAVATTWLYEVEADDQSVVISIVAEPDDEDRLGHYSRLSIPRHFAVEIGRALSTLEGPR